MQGPFRGHDVCVCNFYTGMYVRVVSSKPVYETHCFLLDMEREEKNSSHRQQGLEFGV
jgi:hypothetical protein